MSQATSRRLFGFPNPVNDTSARIVATGVVLQGVVYLVVLRWWVLVPLFYGFVARVLTGPTLSPLGQFATRVVTPRLHVQHRFLPGPPKRFAQAIGLTFSGGALLAAVLDQEVIAIVLIAGLVVAASLEAFLGYCLGCKAFSLLMKAGVIPESVCIECADITARLAAATR